MIIQKIPWDEQLKDLLPQGIVWEYDPDTNIDGLILSLQSRLQAAEYDLVDLFNDLMPDSTTGNFLDRWETQVGLPNDCSKFSVFTSLQRRQNVLSQLNATGGQSIQYYLDVMEIMGYPNNTITEYSALRIGDPCDSAVRGEDWDYAWSISIPDQISSRFNAQSDCDDPLDSGTDQWLQCLMLKIKPAHTILFFDYMGDLPPTAISLLDNVDSALLDDLDEIIYTT